MGEGTVEHVKAGFERVLGRVEPTEGELVLGDDGVREEELRLVAGEIVRVVRGVGDHDALHARGVEGEDRKVLRWTCGFG